MMDIIDSAAADIGIPTHWILTQASGTAPTHTGNAWENRLAIKDIAAVRPNAAFGSANYALPLVDASHLNATGKVIAGEKVGACAAPIENGGSVNPIITPTNAIANGTKVLVQFQSPIQTVIDRQSMPAPIFKDGFQITGQPANFVTKAVPTSDGHLTVHCAGPLPDNCNLNYAFSGRTRLEATEDVPFPFGRGCLRTTRSMPSLILPDTTVHDWVPAFSIPVQNAA